jgi:hypothetical protein
MVSSLGFFTGYALAWTAYFIVAYELLLRYSSKSVYFSSKPSEAAYLAVIVWPVSVLAIEGFMHFRWNAYTTWQERISTPEDCAIRLCILQCVWQICCFAWHILGRYTFSAAMLGHHLATLTLCALVAVAPYSHWGISFFAGVIEFTNLPLTVIDLFKAFKELQIMYPGIHTLTRATFSISFLVLRIGFWLPMFWIILTDAKELVAVSNSIGLQQVCAFYMVPSLGFLTGLQFFWGWKIVCAATTMLGNGKPSSDKGDLPRKDPDSYGAVKP